MAQIPIDGIDGSARARAIYGRSPATYGQRHRNNPSNPRHRQNRIHEFLASRALSRRPHVCTARCAPRIRFNLGPSSLLRLCVLCGESIGFAIDRVIFLSLAGSPIFRRFVVSVFRDLSEWDNVSYDFVSGSSTLAVKRIVLG